jgi:hypothetical protein
MRGFGCAGQLAKNICEVVDELADWDHLEVSVKV